jgi:tight adherence protein B
MDSDDFSWAVMAIRIQREVGGNLAELLMTVADTMTQRERLRREVSTLTAEGKMSAIIIGALPPGLAMVMFMMNPAYIKELFSPGLGYGLLAGAVVMMIIGFAWMKKTITIEV